MQRYFACLLAVALLALTACQVTTRDALDPDISGSESSQEESGDDAIVPDVAAGSILEAMDGLYEELDDARLPDQDYTRIAYTYDPETTPPQILLDEPKAYEIAALVQNYLYFGGNILEDFAEPDSLYRPAALQTVLYHTTPVVANWEYSMGSGVYEYHGPYEDHVIYHLLKQEIQEGRAISDIVYADAVEENFRQLFGDVDFYHQDLSPYYYYAREHVYARVGDFGGPMFPYPQIIEYNEDGDTLTCRLVIAHALDRETPIEVDGVELNADNFDEVAATLPQYVYTFTAANDGHYTLTALQTVAAEADGESEPAE